MSPPPSSLPPPPSPRLSDSAASEMTVLPTTPIRTAPPSPMHIMRTPSSPSTTIIYGTPASNLSIPTLHNDDSYFDDGDLLGLGELSMSHDDDTEPSTSDDISHSNNSYNTSNKDIILPPVTSEEDKIYENAKGFRPIIYSYLMKLGRNGKWQKRFFECDGGSLTYFKTEKRKKHQQHLTCDDISNSNNSHMNKSIFQVSDGVTSEEDKIFENAKGFRPIIYSYLRKLGRNGKWQRRFFECDGASLTYYKTEKRKKHLATLDLAKVGSIAISAEDESGCTFHIQVADRPYSLKAESESVCVDWVITLNRIKEARMQIGRVKLVTPKLPALLLAPSTDEKEENYKLNEENDVCAAPRMILEANRPRTRGVDKSQWQEIMAILRSDGGSLTYFKTEKRKKHLATLDLAKVGSIAISAEDKSGCTFHIQVADRPYSLMAESESVCVDWVITLNRVKEARMQIGRVKLVIPKLPVLQPAASMDEKDENYKLDEGNDACTAVRVVLEANRPRTRCADNSQWQEIMRSATSNTANSTVPGSQLSPVSSPARQFTKEAFESIPLESRQNLAVWEKPSRLERIRDKILKWARSIKKAAISCRSSQAENIMFGEINDNDNANAEQSSESPNPIPGVKESNIPRTSLKDEKSATLNNTNNSMNKPNLIPVDDDGETRHLT
eukprot:CAMPEP_0194159288 /NCGR_PEP_ID=MMETSP0152-20130528/77745_1 /TAXON_ID=1049557 /ORGANISM="Thalassiothrix antarctica, Strain L6-D1" /LENGTH=669 /DNA_ID=CAMNT_0038868837 /DNA_START=505 /DNA_END=2516 /DNA_ORIENTATION=-